MARLSKKKVAEAIVDLRGNVSAVARKFQVSRQRIYNYMNDTHPDLWDLVKEQREVMLDTAEDILGQKIERGEVVPLIFYLKTQGKDRGYVEREERKIDGTLSIDLKWEEDDANA